MSEGLVIDPAVAAVSGFYGKLPARGDFVTRRLAGGFTEPWDEWLQQALSCSRDQLGGQWLDLYLTSPIWRFVLCGGLCGTDAVAGVLMPSVDRVGRYFPLTVAAPMADCANPAAVPAAAERWYAAAERLALSALDDNFDFDGFDNAVADLGGPKYDRGTARPHAGADVGLAGAQGWQFGLTASASFMSAYPDILDQMMHAVFGGYSFWWTTGSDAMPPTAASCRGLPSIGGFVAMLDGRWDQWGWTGGQGGGAPVLEPWES